MKGPGGGGGDRWGGADEMANLSNMFDAQTAAGDQRQPDGDMARKRATAYCKVEREKRKGNLNRRMRAGRDWDGGPRVSAMCPLMEHVHCKKPTFKNKKKKKNHKN